MRIPPPHASGYLAGMPDDVVPEVAAWLASFAETLGVPSPTDDEIESLLALAGMAARASARQAAPVACWLVARSGIEPARAVELLGG